MKSKLTFYWKAQGGEACLERAKNTLLSQITSLDFRIWKVKENISKHKNNFICSKGLGKSIQVFYFP